MTLVLTVRTGEEPGLKRGELVANTGTEVGRSLRTKLARLVTSGGAGGGDVGGLRTRELKEALLLAATAAADLPPPPPPLLLMFEVE